MTNQIITVRDLIIELLDSDLNYEVFIKDKDGKRLHNVSVCTKENKRVLSCLFG